MMDAIDLDKKERDSSQKLHIKLLATHPTAFDPQKDLKISSMACLDGCIVPSESSDAGARISFSHVVVLDNFVDYDTLAELRDFLLGDPKKKEAGSDEIREKNGILVEDNSGLNPFLPTDRWEKKTADMDGASATWGVRASILERLAEGEPLAMIEVQSRLCKIFPDVDIGLMPSSAMQQKSEYGPDEEKHMSGKVKDVSSKELGDGNNNKNNSKVSTADPKEVDVFGDCSAILVNAALPFDEYRYHVDADPSSLPQSPWTDCFGDYINGEPGKPLMVTMLLYLNESWKRDWGGETLFLDGETDVGLCVSPKPGRVVLMDQDVLHRVSVTSSSTDGLPRLSLVWKLVFLPKYKRQECSVIRSEWGRPMFLGSAAHVEAVKDRIAREMVRKRKQGCLE